MKKVFLALLATMICSSALADGICGYVTKHQVSGDFYITQRGAGANAAMAVLFYKDASPSMVMTIHSAMRENKVMCADISAGYTPLRGGMVAVRLFKLLN